MKRALVVFAKHWTPGRVKTRLAKTLGTHAATAIYREFLEAIANRYEGEADERFIYYSPADREADFAEWVGPRRWRLRPQHDGDLGARMGRCVEDCRQLGFGSVVIIGTDSPNLPLAWLRAAFDQLRHHDVVLGPTSDGGYYLIGMNAPYLALFQDVDWGTEVVWQQTQQRLDELADAVTAFTLPRWYDVDRHADLQQLQRDLRRPSAGVDRRQDSLRTLSRSLDDICGDGEPVE